MAESYTGEMLKETLGNLPWPGGTGLYNLYFFWQNKLI